MSPILQAYRQAFLAKMAEKGKELGLSASRFENASGLTGKSRTSAADLLKIGRAALGQPALAAAWAETSAVLSVGGPHARKVPVSHVYAYMNGWNAFLAKRPFLGGKGGSLFQPYPDTRSHLMLTEVEGRKLLIAISGQRYDDDPFVVDLAICDRVAAELRGEPPPESPVLEGLSAIGAGYAYTTLDGAVAFASALAEKVQVPASTTKIMTALCCLDVVKDVERTLVVRRADIRLGSGFPCHVGDEMTYRDALLAMMLPSSNTLAEAVASNVGEILLGK